MDSTAVFRALFERDASNICGSQGLASYRRKCDKFRIRNYFRSSTILNCNRMIVIENQRVHPYECHEKLGFRGFDISTQIHLRERDDMAFENSADRHKDSEAPPRKEKYPPGKIFLGAAPEAPQKKHAVNNTHEEISENKG